MISGGKIDVPPLWEKWKNHQYLIEEAVPLNVSLH